MTHIEQMIQDMCPNGVEFKTLGEVEKSGLISMGRGNVISKDDMKNTPGDYPVYSSSSVGNGEIGRYGLYMFDDERITWSIDGGGKFFYRNNHKYSVTNVGGWIKVLREDIITTKFLYYILIKEWTNKVYDYNHKAHPSVIREEYEIPLPPIEIQKKIVECLDKFSALAAELQAELQMRRKQYEYYRTQLLTPHSDCNSADNTDDCNWVFKPFEEIFELRGGYTPSKNKPQFWEGGTIPWFRMEDIRTNGRVLSDALLYITPEAVKGKGLFEKDSFVLATSATIGEHALLAVDALTNQRFTNLKVRKQYKDLLYTQFIFHYMFKVDEFCKAHTNISGFESVDMDALRKMPFPLPPLAEQARIVSILDKFEALTTSLSDGIPAEQAAQQKRYEYYRDLLLTFDRKAV